MLTVSDVRSLHLWIEAKQKTLKKMVFVLSVLSENTAGCRGNMNVLPIKRGS